MEPANKNSCGPENPAPESEIKNENVSFLRTASNWSGFAQNLPQTQNLKSKEFRHSPTILVAFLIA